MAVILIDYLQLLNFLWSIRCSSLLINNNIPPLGSIHTWKQIWDRASNRKTIWSVRPETKHSHGSCSLYYQVQSQHHHPITKEYYRRETFKQIIPLQLRLTLLGNSGNSQHPVPWPGWSDCNTLPKNNFCLALQHYLKSHVTACSKRHGSNLPALILCQFIAAIFF